MDFNKWIYEGVPYVTEDGETKLREKYYGSGEGWEREQARMARIASGISADEAWQPAENATEGNGNGKEEKRKKTITLERDSDITFVDGVKAQIGAWLATRASATDATSQHELLLPECNSFLRLAIHQWFETVTAESPLLAGTGTERSNLFLETRPIAGQRWKVSFVLCHYTPSEKRGLEAAAAVKKRASFDAKLGFKLVWNLLRQAARPIVVHNGFYDVLFMWSHFESPLLPPTLPEFKQTLADKFAGGVFDTKFLSNSRQFMFPFEHWTKLAAAASTAQLSPSAQARIQAVQSLGLAPESLAQCRFRETHLEKLYLVLKKETAAREAGTNPTPSPEPTASSTAPTLFGAANPPPPLGGVKITLADGFDKYALIGQPGGDASAAHEAGYDAFMTAVRVTVTRAPAG